MFENIFTIDDVLPHISLTDGIFVAERDRYTVIDYSIITENTFATPMSQECRGLKFAPDGKILARPFHKFFNLGERCPPGEFDWTAPHVVMDKLDGSMIHPCMLGDDLVFMTRMGVTEQAELALSYATQNVLNLCQHTLAQGQTAVFEFTSPENRVVIDYAVPTLTLLAVRNTVTGAYTGFSTLKQLGTKFGVPVVESFAPVNDVKRFITDGRALEGVEGYVIAFENGTRLKLKSDAYVLRHKALSGLEFEKNILAWVASDALDDVLPLLHSDMADQVRAYSHTVMTAAADHVATIETLVQTNQGADRKSFAGQVQAHIDPRLQSIAFRRMDGHDSRKAMKDVLLRAAGSETKVNSIRNLFGMEWNGPAAKIDAD
jgi:RNA ligase